MTQEIKRKRYSGTADAICRSRFTPYLFSFLFAAFGLGVVFVLARAGMAYLYETRAAGWYGLLSSLGRPNTLAAFSNSKEEELAFLSFAFNPVNRLLSLIPASSFLLGVCAFNAIRCGLAAAAFAYFLKLRKSGDLSAVLFSVLYALSSYSLVTQLTGVSADGVIVLPLMLAGIERILARRGFALFSVSLAVSAVVSFRTVFGFFVFSFLWMIVARCSRPDAGIKPLLFDTLLLILAVPVAILLSAPVLFPSFDNFLLTFEDLSFKQSYNIVEFFGKMLPSTYDGLVFNRLPYLFVGMAPLLLLPIFFLCRKIPVREKVSFGILLFVLYFTFSVNVTAAFWDLFAVPDGYAHVVAIVFPVLFLALSARALDEADRRSERSLASAALIFSVIVALLQRFDLSYEAEGGTKVVWFSEINTVWIALPFLAIGCAAAIAVIRAREARPGKPIRLLSLFSVLLIFATVLDVAVSNAFLARTVAEKEWANGVYGSYTPQNVHDYPATYFATYANEIEAVGIGDSLYRAEKLDAITENDASYLGYASLGALPSEMLSAFGIELGEKGELKTVSSPLSLSLFGVRYLMTHEPIEITLKQKKQLKQSAEPDPVYDVPGKLPDSVSSFFGVAYRDDFGTVYENDYVLPILFRAAAIPDGSILDGVNATPYSRINEVFRTLTGNDTLSLYRPAEVTGVSTPFCSPAESNYEGYAAYTRNSSNGTASLIYTVTVSRDGPLFCSFPSEFPYKLAEIKVDGTGVGRAYTEVETEDGNGVKTKVLQPNAYYLGDYTAGTEVRVSIAFGSGVDGALYHFPENVPFVYEIDLDAVESAFAYLTSGIDSLEANGEKIRAELSEDDRPAVVSTLPFSVADSRGNEKSSFLGRFAAWETDQTRITVAPALNDFPVLLLSFAGCILLAALLFFESLAAKGARIPFFTYAAGNTDEDEKP